MPSSDPYGPYKRYTDPDPNIRFEMMRQQQWRKGMTRAYWAPPQRTPDEPRNCRSQPGEPVTIAPAGNISFEIEAGQRLRLSQPEGEQVADLISFNRDDMRELLSMHSSRAVNLNWKLTAPHVLYSNRSRGMWQIEKDLTGENYCGGGYCSEHLNVARYGAKGKGAPNCQSNLETAVRGYGMDRWSFNVDACFNVFMTVAYDANGKWEIRPPKGKPGDYMIMQALMPQIVAISNCPVLFNACNNFRLKPLAVEILAERD